MPPHRTSDSDNVAAHREFPKSSGYHPDWVFDGHMGGNPLWLVEWLCEIVEISPDARVLDLGCGKALTSVFLAEEYQTHVVALDLWIGPTENWQRVAKAGLQNKIIPLQGEAHQLPFAEGYFDVVICVDAYNYFGTDELYLEYLSRFVRPGGHIGVVLPGWYTEVDQIPEHLTRPGRHGGSFWEHEMAFHSASWWERLWKKTPSITDVKAETMEDGGHLWAEWESRKMQYFGWDEQGDYGQAVLDDNNRNLTFLRIAGRKIV